MDCLIVGGGLIGMLTARELARAGMSVRLLERGVTGRESSWAGGGILSPLAPWDSPAAVNALSQWGQRRFPALCADLQTETGIDPEWTRSGLLVLDPDQVPRARRWANAWGVRHEVLDDVRAIAAIEPGCRPASSAVWLPDVAQVRNPRLVRALALSLAHHRVAVTSACEVTALVQRQGRIRGVRTATGVIEAGHVVIAGGAWSAGLLASLGVRVDIRPVRGQMLLYRAPPGLLHRIVISGGHYLIPRRDGLVLAGSTLEHSGFDKSTTAAARDELQRITGTLAPGLVSHPVVRQWAGLRPGTADGVPLIGAVPGVEGLYVNAGHFRNGVSLAPGSARLLSDILLGHSRIVDPSPYSPASLSSVP